jgi:hypothetical protein
MAFRGDWRLFLPVCSPAEKGIPDRSFRADRAHVAIYWLAHLLELPLASCHRQSYATLKLIFTTESPHEPGYHLDANTFEFRPHPKAPPLALEMAKAVFTMGASYRRG